MNHTVTRRKFLTNGLLITGLAATPDIIAQQDKPLPIDSKIVEEFVRVAHSDFNKVQEMHTKYPLLLNASWDWGGGDFETGIGAAGHMGLKEIANYLLDKGARADIFVLTMLGKTDPVKLMLKDYPNLLNSLGPHGFTLLHHAEKGGQDSLELFNYLQTLGLKDKHRKLF